MKEYNFSERHMGTAVTLALVCTDETLAQSIAKETFATIANYEQTFSRFLPDSELSKLNQTGQSRVSERFLRVLQRSLGMYHLTKGGFNPLVQAATLGYRQNFKELPDRTKIISPDYNTDLDAIQITGNRVTLAPGQQLDFGRILKGYLANTLADHISTTYNNDCPGLIVNIGGDLATRGTDVLHEPFIFMLYNPLTDADIPITISNTSLATSGTYARQWQTTRGTRHHIIDGHTHENPDTDLVAVSIIHGDGATTEALTKLFLTKGVAEAIGNVPPEEHQYQYFCVTSTGHVTSTIA